MSEEKKRKNLGTYAICMILAFIILIIFAAMADSREEHFENQINEKEQVNMNIQNQIVTLTDENYTLKQEAESQKKIMEETEKELLFYQTMTKTWMLYEQGDIEGANEAIFTIDPQTLTEEQKAAYNALHQALN